jgi:hypothetical protein
MEPEAEKAGNDEAREEPGVEPGAGTGAEALPPGEKRCCCIATLYSVYVSTVFSSRFKVKKWNAVAVWSWNVLTDTCAICRNNLHEPSIEYQAQGFVEEQDHPGLSIAWGAKSKIP